MFIVAPARVAEDVAPVIETPALFSLPAAKLTEELTPFVSKVTLPVATLIPALFNE